MELVEGDDLSQRLARGAIPLDEAPPIAKQMAEALDFGLAKALDPPAASSAEAMNSPTITSPGLTIEPMGLAWRGAPRRTALSPGRRGDRTASRCPQTDPPSRYGLSLSS